MTVTPRRRALLLFAVLAALLASPAEAKLEKGKQFDDWVVACEPREDGKGEQCFAQQMVGMAEGGGRVLTAAVGYLGPKNEATLITILPLGINLQTGAAFKVDDGKQYPLSLQQCTTAGCRAVAFVDDALLRTITAGKAMAVGVMPWGNPQTVLIPVSLKGLAAALAASK
jgi:invasion protein IalB